MTLFCIKAQFELPGFFVVFSQHQLVANILMPARAKHIASPS
jgi:hypothetical protein